MLASIAHALSARAGHGRIAAGEREAFAAFCLAPAIRRSARPVPAKVDLDIPGAVDDDDQSIFTGSVHRGMFARLRRKVAGTVNSMRLPPVARAVRDGRLTYLSNERFLSLRDAARRVRRRGVPGDFVEFGIALGGSAVYLASEAGPDRSFHGFDVFGMIPAPGTQDDDKTRERYEVIRSGRSQGIGGDLYYGYEDDLLGKVSETFRSFGYPVDNARVHLHPGLFEDTVRFGPGDRVALAHIDCDWYDPVKLCLKRTAPVLSPGGMMILDDYNDYGGCRKAVDEFLASHQGYDLLRTEPHAVILKR